MVHRFKKVVLLCTILCVSLLSNAQQIKQFADDEVLFFQQMEQFFSNSAQSQDLLKYLKQFKKYWESGAIDRDEKSRIVETSNALLKKYGKPSPHFYNYLQTVELFFNTDHPTASYHAWNEAYRYLLKAKSLNVADKFCKGTLQLLQDHDIYSSATVTWKLLRVKSFTFKFENNIATITMPPTDLQCTSAGNSFIIHLASGYYLPFDNKWVGDGGKVFWERSNFNSESVYAELSNYSIDMTKYTYKADSVWFTNDSYYGDKIFGSLEDKTVTVKDPSEASYPRFKSYQNIFVIKDIYPGIDYRGGFSMNGSRFIGSGTVQEPATLKFSNNGKKIFQTSAIAYTFQRESISSRNAAVSIYIDQDSIYHPGLLFRYNVATRTVNLIRNGDTENLSRSPYFDSYHMLDMDFQQLTWQIDGTEMKMGGLEGTNLSKAAFESSNYFRAARYQEIGMYNQIHPLVALRRLSKEKKTETFSVKEYASYMRMPEPDAIHLCLDLSFRGMIQFDSETNTLVIKERTYEYLDAVVGKIDYDVIRFDSEHDMKGMANATLDLNNLELNMVGVSKIQVSDSQNVVFYPRGSQLTMSKNRNFEFDGVIETGLFTFYGRGFDFNYENFKINLQNVDSLKIKVKSFKENQYGIKDYVQIKNSIEHVTGDILIDDPNNKSSIKDFPQYPIFNSKQTSYVYYDYPSIYNGVYDRNKFYYKVDPFSIDSVNDFSTDALFFEGELISADIFANIREKIVVQPDYSFGFTRVTGKQGYPVYKGKGTFTDTINLSFKGLRGIGTLDYMNAKAVSGPKGYTFFPDSTNGFATNFNIKQQSAAPESPSVTGESVNIHWEPYENKLMAVETGKAFKMYGDSTTLSGGLIFTPKGLGGWGKYTFSEAELTSQTFEFKEKIVNADSADFDLKTQGGALDEMAFKTKNVKANIDFTTKKANFQSNDTLSLVQLPKNMYICYLTKFTWDMQTKQIALGDPKDKNTGKCDLHFYSVHPKQDTLNFQSPYATYDLKNYIIGAQQVPFIDVADSRIVPHKDSTVTIHKEAFMDTLRNAKLIADREHKYHTVYDATFFIKGRNNFAGRGMYDFIDETGVKHPLPFTKIRVDQSRHTYGKGKLEPEDNFKLSSVYSYYGDYKMLSTQQFLEFNGNVLIANECAKVKPAWFSFVGEINPAEIFIPVSDNMFDVDSNAVGTSIFVNTRPTGIYTAFTSEKRNDKDIPMLSAQGSYLFYDKNTHKYKVGPKEKILDESKQGNLISYHREYCNTAGEGKINLGIDLGQVKYGTYGTITHNINSGRVTLETVATLDFMFDDNVLKAIADTITKRQNLKGVSLNTPSYKKGMTEMLGNASAEKYISEALTYGEVRKITKELEHTFVFSKLDMVWDSAAHAFRSVGQIGIQSIGNVPVNRTVNGFVEFANLYRGDLMNIYIELDRKTFIFFHYSEGKMHFFTSDMKNANNKSLFDLVNTIANTKEAKRTMTVGKKEAPYTYTTGNDNMKRQFVETFKGNKPHYDPEPVWDEDEEVKEKPKKQKPEARDEYDDYDDYED